MKQLFIIMFLFSSLYVFSEEHIIVGDNFDDKDLKNVQILLPDARSINSGTKIIVTYEGEWPEYMKGAFDHAVRIWEENLPISLPIFITAKLEEPRKGNFGKTPLSSVQFRTIDFTYEPEGWYTSPTTLIKSVLLQEYNSTQQHRFIGEISDTKFLDKPDIIISYNKNRIKELSCSLDGNMMNLYDFVTLALRDIALGLGFMTSFTADVQNETIETMQRRYTPFELNIYRSIESDDSHETFTNATKGTVPIDLFNWLGHLVDYFDVYAPSPWVNGKSLRFLIPQEGKPITKLLTHNFGKGYIMRDLSDCNWNDIFCGALDWRKLYTTSSSSGFVDITESGETSLKIPYNGEFTFEIESYNNANVMPAKGDSVLNVPVRKMRNSPVDLYCKPYGIDVTFPDEYISIAALLKNGKWDVLLETDIFEKPFKIRIESLKLHHPSTEYAIAASGGLRYRFLHHYRGGGCAVKYYTRDFTPPKPVIGYQEISITPAELSEASNTMVINSGGPIIPILVNMVEVGLSNIEGADMVIAEVYEGNSELPYSVEVENFRNGRFFVEVDVNQYTSVTVYSYNQNGSAKSNTIIIPPKHRFDLFKLKLKTIDNYLEVQGLEGFNDKGVIYKITHLLNTNFEVSGNMESGNMIDISDLPKGVYVLNLYCGNNLIGQSKFTK